MGDAQAMLPHVLDMLGPWIDERDLLTRLHHMRAGIPADGTRPDDSYLSTHAFLPALLESEASAPARITANGEPRRADAERYLLATPGSRKSPLVRVTSASAPTTDAGPRARYVK